MSFLVQPLVIVSKPAPKASQGLPDALARAGFRADIRDLEEAVCSPDPPYALVIWEASAATMGMVRLLRRRSPSAVCVLCTESIDEAQKAAEWVDAVVSSRDAIKEVARLLNRLLDREEQRHTEALQVARAMVRGLSIRSVETKAHQERLAQWCRNLAEVMGESKLALDVELGALVHDIGMIGVPDSILHKTSALEPLEWVEIRKHCEQGAELIRDVDALMGAIPIVLAHHERWDGKGYPRGLKRTAIPLSARIFAVCDAYEAITQSRPHRPAALDNEARARIQADVNSHFDPTVVEAFMSIDARTWCALAERPAQRP